MKKENIIPSLLFFVLVGVAGYISIGGFSIIDAIEQVREVEKEIHSPIGIEGEIVRERKSSDYVLAKLEAANISLTPEQKTKIRNLDHVIWYWGHYKYSFIKFLIEMPFWALIFLIAGMIGLIGGAIKVIGDNVWFDKKIKDAKYLMNPILGFGFGLLTLAGYHFVFPFLPGISEQVPKFKNITPVLVLGIFAGLYSRRFYNYFQKLLFSGEVIVEIDSTEKVEKINLNKKENSSEVSINQ